MIDHAGRVQVAERIVEVGPALAVLNGIQHQVDAAIQGRSDIGMRPAGPHSARVHLPAPRAQAPEVHGHGLAGELARGSSDQLGVVVAGPLGHVQAVDAQQPVAAALFVAADELNRRFHLRPIRRTAQPRQADQLAGGVFIPQAAIVVLVRQKPVDLLGQDRLVAVFGLIQQQRPHLRRLDAVAFANPRHGVDAKAVGEGCFS